MARSCKGQVTKDCLRGVPALSTLPKKGKLNFSRRRFLEVPLRPFQGILLSCGRLK